MEVSPPEPRTPAIPSPDTRTLLLRALIESRPEYLSGNLVATRFGLSRVAIWNHIEQLNLEGYRIHAIRNRGYLLQAEPEVLHEAGLRAHAGKLGMVPRIYYHDQIDSTNSEVDRLLNEDVAMPFAVLAKGQSKGRGRRGNQWFSSSAGNLYVSFGFDPNLEIARMGHYTLWVGFCVCKYLRQQYGCECRIKWPNDLYLEGRKLAGILTEAKIETDRIRRLIVGLGMNVNGDAAQFPDHLKDRVVSLREALGHAVPFNECAAAILQVVFEASERYFREDIREALRSEWAEYDYLYGRKVLAVGTLETVSGVACGIDASGHLRIRQSDESVVTVHSGEVTLSL